MKHQIKKAVIPAAGLGTRFLPATKAVPKELLPIVDRPAIQYIVEEAIAAGIEEIIFVLSKGKEVVAQHFQKDSQLNQHLTETGKTELIQSVNQLADKAEFKIVYQEKPLGLGHAVLCAKEAVGNEWFFVFLPDDLIDYETPCAVQMLEAWQNHQGAMAAVMEVSWENVHRYGVVEALPMSSGLGKVVDMVEKPNRDVAPSNLAIIGRYLLPASIFPLIEATQPGAIGEIQLTDALLGLRETPELYAYQFKGERFDTGNKFGFLEASLHYGLKNPELKQPLKELIHLIAESR